MLLTRKLDAQYQEYNKTIHKIFLEEIPLLLPKFEHPERFKRTIIGILFKAIGGITLEAVSTFIRQRKGKVLHKVLLCMRKQQKFQGKRLEYLEEAMILHGTHSADIVEEIIDAVNHLPKNITKCENMLGSNQPYWYKDSIMERRITHMILNSLLYLYELQMKYIYVNKDLIRKLYISINASWTLSTGYLPIS